MEKSLKLMQVPFVSQTAAALPQNELQHMSHGQLVQAANVLHAGWTTASRQSEQALQESRLAAQISAEEREATLRSVLALETRLSELSRELASERVVAQCALSKLAKYEAAALRQGDAVSSTAYHLLEDELLMAKADIVRLERTIRMQKMPDVRMLEQQLASLQTQREASKLELQQLVMDLKCTTAQKESLCEEVKILQLELARLGRMDDEFIAITREPSNSVQSLDLCRPSVMQPNRASVGVQAAGLSEATEVVEARHALRQALESNAMLHEQLSHAKQRLSLFEAACKPSRESEGSDAVETVSSAAENSGTFEAGLRESNLHLMDRLALREDACGRLEREAKAAQDRAAQLALDLNEAMRKLETANKEQQQLEHTVRSLTSLSPEDLEGLAGWQEQLNAARRRIKVLEREVQLNAADELKTTKLAGDNVRLQVRLERCQEDLATARVELDELRAYLKEVKSASAQLPIPAVSSPSVPAVPPEELCHRHAETIPEPVRGSPPTPTAAPAQRGGVSATDAAARRQLELLFLVALGELECTAWEHRAVTAELFAELVTSNTRHVSELYVVLVHQARRDAISHSLELAALRKQLTVVGAQQLTDAVEGGMAASGSIGGPSLGLGLVALGGGSLTVESVTPDGPAYFAGIKNGDALVAVNAKRVKTLDDVSEALLGCGSKVTLLICPGGPLFAEEIVEVSLS